MENEIGVSAFLDHLRALLKSGDFWPQPVRERKIPKPGGSGKVRRLGIPTVTDRVVQAALKLALEPIFEADFEPVSYGFRPQRRGHDAIAEIHMFGTLGYRWVLDAKIKTVPNGNCQHQDDQASSHQNKTHHGGCPGAKPDRRTSGDDRG
jgi:RNA-directed DNA polymerase